MEHDDNNSDPQAHNKRGLLVCCVIALLFLLAGHVSKVANVTNVAQHHGTEDRK